MKPVTARNQLPKIISSLSLALLSLAISFSSSIDAQEVGPGAGEPPLPDFALASCQTLKPEAVKERPALRCGDGNSPQACEMPDHRRAFWCERDGRKEGQFVIVSGNGTVLTESRYTHGVLNGRHREFFPSGSLSGEAKFVNGQFNGLSTTWYENGQKQSEVSWKQGKKSGLAQAWYPNGKLQAQVEWANDLRHGRKIKWSPTGEVTLNETYSQGQRIDGSNVRSRKEGDDVASGNSSALSLFGGVGILFLVIGILLVKLAHPRADRRFRTGYKNNALPDKRMIEKGGTLTASGAGLYILSLISRYAGPDASLILGALAALTIGVVLVSFFGKKSESRTPFSNEEFLRKKGVRGRSPGEASAEDKEPSGRRDSQGSSEKHSRQEPPHREPSHRPQQADPFKVLGISPGSSETEIKSAYHQLIAQYHPDTVASMPEEFQDLAKKKSQEINWAYQECKKKGAA